MIAFLRHLSFAFFLMILAALTPTDGRTEPLMPLAIPSGPVVLTIEGKIQNANQATSAHFDLAMLKRLPPTIIATHTPWTDGLIRFKGVSVAHLLRLVAANGTHGEFTALNDYTARIPLSDFDTFDAILAYDMNGQPMTRREKGPLWLIYPMDQHDELQAQRYRDRMVWQMRTITVQ